jgi:hypothetical protein
VHLSKEEKAKDLASISASGEIKISKYDQKRFSFICLKFELEDLNFVFKIFRCNVPFQIGAPERRLNGLNRPVRL